jgi:AcrR family transcriptional regulator
MATTQRVPKPATDTRSEILRVALDLFTTNGFEGTSIRDIARAVGHTQSSLYHYFASKDAIATALMGQRGQELDDLLAWIQAQPPSDHLARDAALRWLDQATPEQLQGMRFAHANQPFMRKFAEQNGDFRTGFDDIVRALLPSDAGMPEQIRLRMAFGALGAAAFSADGTAATPDDIIAAARLAAADLTSVTR